MSERTHASEPFEDNESDSSPPPRRPGALPIPHLAELKAPASAEQPKPKTERPPLILFDRAFEAQVSVPGSHVPEAAQEAAKATAESGEESDDDDDEEKPAAEAAEPTSEEQPTPSAAEYQADALPTPLTEVASEPEPAAGQQYASPIIPAIPRPGSVPRSIESFDAVPAEAGVELESASEDPFEKMMLDAGIDPRGVELSPDIGSERLEPGLQEMHDRFSVVSDSAAPNLPPVPPSPPVNRGGSGGFPPLPPRPRPVPGPNPNVPYNYAYNVAPTANPNTIVNQGYTDDDLHRARQSGARQGVVAGALAGGLAGRYFANRKARKEQQKMKAEHTAELEQRDATLAQHIDKLRGTPEVRDAITGRHIPSPAERPVVAPSTMASSERPAFGTLPVRRASESGRPIATAVRGAEAPVVAIQPEAVNPEQASDQQPNPFEKQSNEPHHKVRSEWLEIGVDQHGRAVQQEYGRAFQEETRQEQTGNRTFTSDPHAQQSGTHENQPHSAGYYIGAPHIGTDHQLDSGQIPSQQRLQPGSPTHQDPQHLLQSPKKQAASNIINPWFWLMLAVVIVVFFAAASL